LADVGTPFSITPHLRVCAACGESVEAVVFLKPQPDAVVRRVGKLGYLVDKAQNEEHFGVIPG
jgi:hypothetical protein